MGVYRKISTIEDDINRLLSNLKGKYILTQETNIEKL